MLMIIILSSCVYISVWKEHYFIFVEDDVYFHVLSVEIHAECHQDFDIIVEPIIVSLLTLKMCFWCMIK